MKPTSAHPAACTIASELRVAGDYVAISASDRPAKKNFAEKLSRALASRYANALRVKFPGILPGPDGRGQESRARTSKGVKKLDVNYSTVELGLGLGVSIKTLNFRDPSTRRYTKNFTRADNELRAEAGDYHTRQPYAVLCAVIFLPLDACLDGGTKSPSSFGQAVRLFRERSGRTEPDDDPTAFELVLLGLYDTSPAKFGKVGFFDVTTAPPRTGIPAQLISFEESVAAITAAYDQRNNPPFQWADGARDEAPIERDEDADD
ncbi:MAG: hypothetical protein JNK46_12245 [Methylobacteriaceae bacterium]|nr:hypothetical protein [Methylobacteriaceae bacterium]